MKQTSFITYLVLATAVAGVLAGCASTRTDAASAPTGGKLWAQNCVRCHNGRSPTEFSDAQWDVVLLHMRVRAGLTARDTRAIREFLRTAN